MARVAGGRKLKAFLRRARSAKTRSKVTKVGFFATARYPEVHVGKNGGRKQEPHPVAQVAAWNEFGTETIPERPFIRNAIGAAEDDLMAVLIDGVDPTDMAVDFVTASKMGLVMQAKIQQSIVTLRQPPNALVTKIRKGSSNPLVDTGFMRQSVTYQVDDD